MAAPKKKKSESCDAELAVDGIRYYGKTGTGQGHAEMDALNNMIKAMIADYDKLRIEAAAKTLLGAKKKTVFCPSRACCKKCSAVLHKLGFKAGKDSSFSDESMGKTQWYVGMNVRALFALTDIDLDKIDQL